MVLALRYGDLSSAISETTKLADELGQYCDDLSRKVQQKMYSVEGGMSSALNSADYYVKAKITQLRIRENNAQMLSTKTQTLLDTAKRVDIDVERTIQANQKSFFQRNPELKAPWYQRAFVAFMCDLRNIGGFLGTVLANRIEQQASAWKTLLGQISTFWANNWPSIIVVLGAVAILALIVFTGGTGLILVFGLGLVAGAVSTLVGDVINNAFAGKKWYESKLSSWESYAGSALGSAAGFAAGGLIASGGVAWIAAKSAWTVSGAVTGAASTLITSVLERATGKSQKSVLEISLDTIISGAVGAVVGLFIGKVFDMPALKGIDKWFGQLLGRNSGILTGSGSMLGAGRAQITKLLTGSTQRITMKTVNNIVVATITQEFQNALQKNIKGLVTTFVLNIAVMPAIEAVKHRMNLYPAFNMKVVIPNVDKNAIDIVKSTYKLIPYVTQYAL